MNEQPKALKIAKQLGQMDCLNTYENKILDEAARELFRLHRVNQELLEALEDMHRTQLNNNKHDPDDYENTEQCLRVEAAIQKAKGESNE